jgi:hypothetical protein
MAVVENPERGPEKRTLSKKFQTSTPEVYLFHIPPVILIT